ncbi:MAG: flagellar protein export ATPase FliI [Alphaproteobacteria bacterium]|nr:flagellar protein export ATPase FliI [Alphaproteobacteria bacterium]OJV12508.1 MAG: flagellum-specific ATP synthase FliI [Alphaproteobacteria bacterium 33-17]
MALLADLKNTINQANFNNLTGSISAVKGIIVEFIGLNGFVSVGSILEVDSLEGKIKGECVYIDSSVAKMILFNDNCTISIGSKVNVLTHANTIKPCEEWLGRIISSQGEPLDDLGSLPAGDKEYNIKAAPPISSKRRRVSGKISLGVKVLDTFVPLCYGQRVGIFAGSGVGKSVLLSMVTKFSDVDVRVIGLIGERGREVKEFIEDYIGKEGLKNTIIVVATSDEVAVLRKRAAYITLAISEYFRDQGKEVLCIMDSVTRFAMAQREIGLSLGEPPTTKGYTPTVFAELPKLLERAGPGMEHQGNISGIFSVLVEGDDTNEPIADTVRGIIDGHIILDRKIAERGRYPAINVLKSISRTLPKCHSDFQNLTINRAKKYMAIYEDMEEIIRIGAYRKGTNKEVDDSIIIHGLVEEFIKQNQDIPSSPDESFEALSSILENNLNG